MRIVKFLGISWKAWLLLGLASLLFGVTFANPIPGGLRVFYVVVTTGIGLVVLMIELDNRNRAQETLSLKEEETSLLAQIEEQKGAIDAFADGLDVAVFITDVAGKIMFANPRAADLFKTEEPTGKSVSGVTLSYDLEQAIARVAKNNKPESMEINFNYPSEMIGQVKVWPRTENGQVFVSIIDTSDLVRLRRVRQDFVANVSHELRTPLSIIRALAETLLDEKRPSASLREKYLGKIIHEVDRLAMISNDLLVLSSSESGPVRKQECDLVDVVKGVLTQVRIMANDKGIALTYHGPEQLEIHANPFQVSQVVLNLVDNALKYTNDGAVQISVSSNDQTAKIEVKDTGIGIAEEHLDRIFERFYRVDKARSRASGGTGLGLSIVRHIVEAHGGRVEVDSELGSGSCFTVSLPIKD